MQAYALTLIPNVTDKAFGVAGDTYPLREQLKALGGAWNKQKGLWVFSKRTRYKQVTEALGLTDRESEPQATAKAPEKAPLKVADLLKADATSARHLAMMHLLAGGGLRPDCISKYNGTFGRDRHGKAFGHKEQQSMIWMLNGTQLPVDQLALSLAQDTFFVPENIQDALLECANDYAGTGGKVRMMEDMAKLADSDFCPW